VLSATELASVAEQWVPLELIVELDAVMVYHRAPRVCSPNGRIAVASELEVRLW